MSRRDDTARSTGQADAAWRTELLRSVGMPQELAAAVANGSSHDLHVLIDLLERGCPVSTAMRIAANDDWTAA